MKILLVRPALAPVAKELRIGQKLAELAPNLWGRLWVERGTHNNLDAEHKEEIFHKLRHFLSDL